MTTITQDNPLAQIYGADDQIEILADRILAVHPNAHLLGEEGAFLMAQISITTGARAIPAEAQEIQFWKEGEELVFKLGINFFRRYASEQGGWLPIRGGARPMDTSQRKEWGVIDGDIGYIYRLLRINDIKTLGEFVPFTDLIEHSTTVGIGVVRAEEGNIAPIGKTKEWMAAKRAEQDALTKAFTMPMGGNTVHLGQPHKSDAQETKPDTDSKLTNITTLSVAEINDQLFA